jgi:chromate transporter
MAIGLHRAGARGMLAAWVGFTLPSAVALVAFAYGLTAVGAQTGAGWLAGLAAAAVAVVASAVVGMARTLTPDLPRVAVAVLAGVVVLAVPSAAGSVLALLVGAAAGLLALRPPAPAEGEPDGLRVRLPRRAAGTALGLFAALLVALPLLVAVTGDAAVELVDRFYRAGSLVFGGGHVVLPLLEAEVVDTGLVDRDDFLAGYGAAQAVPGPLFTFAAYLGAVTRSGPTGLLGAVLALLAVFLPSALLVVGALPSWDRVRRAPRAARALAGVGAAVVGLLAATLVDPVVPQAVTSVRAAAVAAAAFALLTVRVPAWAVVAGATLAGALVL